MTRISSIIKYSIQENEMRRKFEEIIAFYYWKIIIRGEIYFLFSPQNTKYQKIEKSLFVHDFFHLQECIRVSAELVTLYECSLFFYFIFLFFLLFIRENSNKEKMRKMD